MIVASEFCGPTNLRWTGAETSFVAGFIASTAETVKVSYRPDATAVRVDLVLGTHYAVTLSESGGVTVVPLAMPAAPGDVTMLRDTPAVQETEFANLRKFDAALHGDLHNRAAMRDAELRMRLGAAKDALENAQHLQDMVDHVDIVGADTDAMKAAAEAARDAALSAVPNVFPLNRPGMEVLNAATITSAYLKEAGREGQFVQVEYSDFASLVDLDTQQGVFVRSTDDPAKVFMRPDRGPLNVLWFLDVVPPDTAGWDALDGGDPRGVNRLALGDQVYTGIAALWAMAKATGRDMYFPGGHQYEISGQRNMPFRQETVTALLDCGGISILTDGPATVFATNSENGADVFQLNGMDNFSIRGFPRIKAVLGDGDVAGTNGVSITNGWDRLHVEIDCLNLPSLDKGDYVDGGKALTIQPADTDLKCGSLTGVVRAKGCAYGFGSDLILDSVASKSMAVDVQFVAEDCYIGATVAALALTSDVPVQMGVNIRGTAINCQRDVDFNRVHGGFYDVQVVTTKTYSERLLRPDGDPWLASDAVVEAFRIVYAKNSTIRVAGDKAQCNYVGRLGATYSGGPAGDTSDCDLYFDVGNKDVINDWIQIQEAFGWSVRNCAINVTPRTAPNGLDSIVYPSNDIRIGSGRRMPSLDLPLASFSGTANSMTLNTYADNAAAVTAGLAAGALYKDVSGVVRAVI